MGSLKVKQYITQDSILVLERRPGLTISGVKWLLTKWKMKPVYNYGPANILFIKPQTLVINFKNIAQNESCHIAIIFSLYICLKLIYWVNSLQRMLYLFSCCLPYLFMPNLENVCNETDQEFKLNGSPVWKSLSQERDISDDGSLHLVMEEKKICCSVGSL